MKRKLLLAAVFLFLQGAGLLFAQDKIRVAATTRTIASLAEEIMGDEAEYYSIVRPKLDVHFISPTPKDVLMVRKADVFMHSGLDLEAWRPPLLETAGRKDFLGAGARAIDVSRNITLLEVPESLSRAEGDIHVFGNPHYALDPVNAKIMARNIASRAGELYPEKAGLFSARLKQFEERLDAALQKWENELRPFAGEAIITYHKSWPYFAKRFNLEVADYLEPKPGIAPTARHLAELMDIIRKKKIKVLVREFFQDSGPAKKLSQKTGVQSIVLIDDPDEVKEAADYISMMDYNVKQIRNALASA